MKRPHVALFLFLISLQITLSQPFASTNAPPGASGGPEYVPGEVLIKFRSDVTDEQIATAFRGASLRFLKQVQTTPMRDAGQIGITHAATVVPVEQALAMLRQVAGVEYAEPNWIYTHQTEAADTYYVNGGLWGMYGALTRPYDNEFGSGAGAVWATTPGSKEVYIGVIDEGIQFSHPDLLANIWKNPDEKEGNRKDDDNNGYKDDIYGWNSYNDNGITYDSRYDDHGTHVAGTIGASLDGSGVVGVSPNVRIITGKFLGPNGGTTADAIQVIDYMTALKTKKGLNIVALNNSWGGGGFSQLLLDAIVRAAKQNILFVAAAGNGDANNIGFNTDATPNYPSCYDTTLLAGYDSVIAVAAIGSDGKMPIFSNYGVETVDLGAPGVAITSTLPNGSYGTYNGTSMATPHVTGAIALYASKYSTATPIEIRAALLGSTKATDSLGSKTVTGGRLDVPGFLTPPTPPDYDAELSAAPANFTGVAINSKTIDLRWSDTYNNEIGFMLTLPDTAPLADGTRTVTLPANTTSYSATVPGAGTYAFSLEAYNNAGPSPSSTVSITSYGVDASVSSVHVDELTKGNWTNTTSTQTYVYGSAGFDIIKWKSATSIANITVYGLGAPPHTWASSTAEDRALLNADGIGRFASAYYGATFTVDLSFAADDTSTHQVALYCLDWDGGTRTGRNVLPYRSQTIDVLDRAGTSLLSKPIVLDSFKYGKYVVLDITGSVTLKFTNTTPGGAQNAVLSGIFIDPVPVQ